MSAYDTLYPATLNIVSPTSVVEKCKADYENMRVTVSPYHLNVDKQLQGTE